MRPVSARQAPAGSWWNRLATRGPTSTGEIDQQLGPGQALDSGLRSRLEPELGGDLGEVRMHTGAEGDRLASAAGAEAFALGSHVAFAGDAYRPGTALGDALIAHELAHVAQQRGATGPATAAGVAEADAEAEANRSAFSRLGGGGAAEPPKLRFGLSLRRCNKTPQTEAQRLEAARKKFHSNNVGITADLTDAEANKVEAAVTLAAKGNAEIAIGFYDYYSSHEINKASDSTLKKWAADQYAATDPGGDTVLRPSLLEASASTQRLATILTHEFVHTHHATNFMGSRDYQEGEAYAVEFFFAKRIGDSARVTEIEGIRSSPGKVAQAAQIPAFTELFNTTYGSLAGLYEVIDSGASKQSGSPFDGMSKEKASELAAELIGTAEASRSAELKKVVAWIKANPKAYPPAGSASP